MDHKSGLLDSKSQTWLAPFFEPMSEPVQCCSAIVPFGRMGEAEFVGAPTLRGLHGAREALGGTEPDGARGLTAAHRQRLGP